MDFYLHFITFSCDLFYFCNALYLLKFQRFIASSIATATATVAPTIGLLPNVKSTFLMFSPVSLNVLLLLKFQHSLKWLIVFYFLFLLKITHDFSFFAHKLHTTFLYISNTRLCSKLQIRTIKNQALCLIFFYMNIYM